MKISDVDRLDELAAAVVDAMPALDADAQRLAVGLYGALAEGHPVDPAGLALRLGHAEEEVRKTLRSWPGVFYDQGVWWVLPNAASAAGNHRCPGRPQVGHAPRPDAKCHGPSAERTAAFGAGVGAQHRRQEQRVPGAPGEQLPAPQPQANAPVGARDSPRQRGHHQLCHFVLLFSYEEVGRVWMGEHPGTVLLSLAEGFEIARRWRTGLFGSALSGLAT